MKKPLKLKPVKPLKFDELMWMCKHFDIDSVEDNVITFSGYVQMKSTPRRLICKISDITKDDHKKT